MKTLEISFLNELFLDLEDIRNGRAEEKGIVRVAKEGDEDDGYFSEIYKLPTDDLYIKLNIKCDSYGDYQRITSIQFVKPIERPVTNYETIK